MVPSDPAGPGFGVWTISNYTRDNCDMHSSPWRLRHSITNNWVIVSENICAILCYYLETKKDNLRQCIHTIKKELRFLKFCFVFDPCHSSSRFKILRARANKCVNLCLKVCLVVHPGRAGTGFGLGTIFKYTNCC